MNVNAVNCQLVRIERERSIII